jgi:hypothetical protein
MSALPELSVGGQTDEQVVVVLIISPGVGVLVATTVVRLG